MLFVLRRYYEKKYIISIILMFVIAIIIYICYNNVNKKKYSLWNLINIQILEDGEYRKTDKYDKNFYIIISPLELSICSKDKNNYNNCNNYNYNYSINFRRINIKSENEELSGKYRYKLKNNSLVLSKKLSIGKTLVYEFGSPSG